MNKETLMQLHIKKIGSWIRNMQVAQSSPAEDAHTVNKNKNQDDSHCVVKDVTNVAR